MNYILSPYSPRAKDSGAKAFGDEGCDHGAQAPTELKPEPPETEAHGAKASEPPLLDHLVLRLLMPEHEPQPSELKPEHKKLKPPEAKASVSRVRKLKPLELRPLTLELKPLELKPWS